MSSIPVVVVAGLHAEVRAEAVRGLLAATPHSVAVHHDLRGIGHGQVERVVLDAWGVRERVDVLLAHGCVSCTIREDVLPVIEHLAGESRLLVIETWGSVEPRAVAEQVAKVPGVHLAGVLTAVDPTGLLNDLGCGERLRARALTASEEDERYVAEVLVRQIEYASTLVLGAGEPEDVVLARTVLEHLGAGTPVTPLDGLTAPRGPLDAETLAARVDPESLRLPVDQDSDGVATMIWRRPRPLHPVRLYEAIDDLAACAVRSRGRLWIANRSDLLLGWDCVSGLLAIEDRGQWLAARSDLAWSKVTPARRAAASLDWRPQTGDRTQLLAFTGPELDRPALTHLLDRCLLTEAEMRAGSEAWSAYADPFAPVLD
ncbi:GTP-binding protein [Actinomadura fulvescens]|uniref:GTP-binding protein n=1 Tax=Actinomadura fulvescens TaxID=46160 RepID=A0ABP6CPX2_9ACTN